MSFLSKNWAGLLACLIISIISWVLGGFLPVVGAPVFAIFIGMILYPFLTPYKQLDAGLTYSAKKLLQYAVILLGFGLNISQVFAVGKSSLPVILSTISIALIIAFFFQRFFNMDTRLFYLWRFCHCSDCSCYSRQGKRSSPSHFCYLFLQCLGSSYLSNSRFLAPSLQRRFCSLCGYCGQRYFLCNSHSQLLGQSVSYQYSRICNHCQTDSYLSYYPYYSLPLLLAKPSTRQQPRSKA